MGLLCTALSFTSCQRCCNQALDTPLETNYVHKYGVPLPKEEWTQKGEEGKIIETLKTGVVVTKTYSRGILNGDATYTFPYSLSLEKLETYSEGILTRELWYAFSGEPVKEILHIDETRSQMTLWSNSGAPLAIEEYEGSLLLSGTYFTEDHQIASTVNEGYGVRLVRDTFEAVVVKETVENGVVVLQSLLSESGYVKEIVPLQNGLKDGIVKKYLAGGEPHLFEEWKNGVQSGITTFYRNGEKFTETPYVNGLKHGIEKQWSDGETLIETITWIKGVRHGPRTVFLPDATDVLWYFKGEEVSKAAFDFSNHEVSRETAALMP